MASGMPSGKALQRRPSADLWRHHTHCEIPSSPSLYWTSPRSVRFINRPSPPSGLGAFHPRRSLAARVSCNPDARFRAKPSSSGMPTPSHFGTDDPLNNGDSSRAGRPRHNEPSSLVVRAPHPQIAYGCRPSEDLGDGNSMVSHFDVVRISTSSTHQPIPASPRSQPSRQRKCTVRPTKSARSTTVSVQPCRNRSRPARRRTGGRCRR